MKKNIRHSQITDSSILFAYNTFLKNKNKMFVFSNVNDYNSYVLECSFYMKGLDLSLAAPKIRKV